MQRRQVLALLAGTLASTLLPARARAAQREILLRGGTLVDGSGSPPRVGDLLIRSERIAAVGRRAARAAGRDAIVLDVRGLAVAPGFVEPHAHISTIDRFPDAGNYLRQGVTTIVASLHSLDQPYPLGAYMDALRAAPNTVWTAGHTWTRRRVIGLANRAPTPDEMRAMETLVREAMADGAIGFGTGLEYIPAAYSTLDEVVHLARVAARPGAMYVTHLRDEGPRLMPALEEAIEVARRSGLRVHVSHVKTTGRANHGQSAAFLRRIERANADGVRATFDVYAYTAYSTYSDIVFPAWALEDGTEAFGARIADPSTRAGLKAEMLRIYADQTGGELASIQFRDGVEGFAGRTLADYVASLGRPLDLNAGLETLIDLQAAGGFTAIFHAMHEADVEAFLRHPLASVSADGDLVEFGRGVPHPRSYGGFPRVLSRYVRERGVLPLEDAVRKMTHAPAAAHGLAERGLLRPGWYADVTVFDPQRVTDTATFTAPHQFPVGIPHVIVNGEFVLRDGTATGARPGRPLRLRTDGTVA
ncbi:MAG: amidohydrolase family protein [Steroidobacteraceae bacterium]|jgi:N-acyl-D-aspartate/D-glutamate deacylase|nr:amidohydrolase family protein [Steroidobacteraceae bacterium]